MLLTKFTINGTVYRLSMEGIALEHFFDPFVMSFSPVKRMLSEDHGGYAALDFGSIGLSPELFGADHAATWPPPAACPIELLYTASSEAAAETLLIGTAHLAKINRKSVEYGLHGPAYDETVADGTVYNDTLVNVLSSILTGIAEISSLNSTQARSPSPNVAFTVDGEQLAIDLAAAVAAFYTHLFYVNGATAYLVDMLGDNGSRTITGFDFFPAEYEYETPVAVVRAGNYMRKSAYPYGKEVKVDPYHGTQANIEAALDDILAVLNAPRCRLPVPLLGSLPLPGEKISWTDTALASDTAAWIRARALTFDFAKERVVIEGEGGLAAA
ncbi:MAG: hypothetical protein JRJ54_05805 [Deltaproteobacteria bacterium]|nr:hypothetical protein [Deltaproteobacteria bacterium]